jgi:hypothetical protein
MLIIYFSLCYGFACLKYTCFPRTVRPEGISGGHHIYFSDLEKAYNNQNKPINLTGRVSSHDGGGLALEIAAKSPVKKNLVLNKTPKSPRYVFDGAHLLTCSAIITGHISLWIFHFDSVILQPV